MRIPVAVPKPWMYTREQEISTLVDNLLERYALQRFDDYVEIHGAASYNTTAARLHTRFFYRSLKKAGDLVKFTIPKA